MRRLINAGLSFAGLFLAAWAADAAAAPPTTPPKDLLQITVAEGSACMGDDKSRKQTEEMARKEATRRASEQVLSLVKSETVVKDMALANDLIAAYSQAQVRVLEELESRWDSQGCYFYKIRAEVTPESKNLGRIQGLSGDSGKISEEDRLWAEIQEQPHLVEVDGFIASYPLSPRLAEAKGLRDSLVAAMPRKPGHYIAVAPASLHFKPRPQSASIGTVQPWQVIEVVETTDAVWAKVRRDFGMAYARFANLRPVAEEELASWDRCSKVEDIGRLQVFLATYPQSPLSWKARAMIASMQTRQTADGLMGQADREEVSFWKRATETRDLRDVREYRRRWPRGKFDRESLDLLIELTNKAN